MTKFNRSYMVEQLKSAICEVTFTKADGTTRVMRATLRDDVLPPQNLPVMTEEYVPRVENLDVVSVWDVEKEAWRSFRVDSVESFGLA